MPDQSTSILVLKKTKLAETDLIITGFSEEGIQVRAVAKGARKPGSRLGVHLELYSLARVLLHKGRSLDIITEANTLENNEPCRRDVEHSAGAAVVVELLEKVSAAGNEDPRLYPLAREALRCIGTIDEGGIALITAAALLKIVAQVGVRPSLKTCIACGNEIESTEFGETEAVEGALAFSYAQGGVICEYCLPEFVEEGYLEADRQLIEWAEVLITSRFADLELFADDQHQDLGFALLRFAREWLRHHLVNRLKSLDFLMSFR